MYNIINTVDPVQSFILFALYFTIGCYTIEGYKFIADTIAEVDKLNKKEEWNTNWKSIDRFGPFYLKSKHK